MSRSLNRVMVIGNLGSDPEVRSTSGGTRVATLSVATNRRWTDGSGNEKTATEWHRAVLWEGLADVAEKYLEKGDRVYLEGSLRYRQWEGKDGQTRYATEIHVRELIMLGSAGEGRREAGRGTARRGAPAGDDGGDFSEDALLGGEDDLPFRPSPVAGGIGGGARTGRTDADAGRPDGDSIMAPAAVPAGARHTNLKTGSNR